MQCLPYSFICILLLSSCASEYKHLQKSSPDVSCSQRVVPRYSGTSWYDASIDVTGRHMSGLLLMKSMPDSSKRVVFTNEAGITFFDFSFSKDGVFKTITIIKQLNKKPVIRTLSKDFALVLGLPFYGGTFERYTGDENVYYGVRQKKGTAYFITNKDCASLQGLEWGTRRKRIVSVRLPGSGYPVPDRIELDHHTFSMLINLTRIKKE